jgi:hypothetical protein
MGIAKDQALEAKRKPPKAQAAMEDKYGGLQRRLDTSDQHWRDVNNDSMASAIRYITENGDAAMFGVTRDGGALVFQIWSGGQARKFYGTANEMEALLDGLK